MANIEKIILKHRDNSTGAPAELESGEVAINTLDKKIYAKDKNNDIVEIGGSTENMVTTDTDQNIKGMKAIANFYSSPSTFAKSKSLELREHQFLGDSAVLARKNIYGPSLSFHWFGVQRKIITMHADGHFYKHGQEDTPDAVGDQIITKSQAGKVFKFTKTYLTTDIGASSVEERYISIPTGYRLSNLKHLSLERLSQSVGFYIETSASSIGEGLSIILQNPTSNAISHLGTTITCIWSKQESA